MAVDLYALARRNGGVFLRRHAVAAGVSDRMLTEWVRRGVVARIGRGVYALPDTPPAAREPRAIVEQLRGTLGGLSAAAWLGAELPEPIVVIHVTVPRNRGRLANAVPGVRMHRGDVSAEETLRVRGVLVTTPLRTALDVARWESQEVAVAVIDSLFRQKRLTLDEFVRACAALPRGPGRRRALAVAALVDPRSGSVLESLCRVLLHRAGLPTPATQADIVAADGCWIGRFDFAWSDVRLVLECDGYEWHADRTLFHRDRRRWSAVTRAGWRLVVVTWFDVVHDPEYVVTLVRDLLAAPAAA